MIVLDSTRPVAEAARLVRLADAGIERWAAAVRADDLRPAGHELLCDLPGDEDQLANLVLLIDALNFCFWGDPPPSIESAGRTLTSFNAVFLSLLEAIRREPRWADARYWCDMSAVAFRGAFDRAGPVPLLAEREQVVRETGRTLLERFDGRFRLAVESVNRRAWDVAALLLCSFESFRDVSEYRGRPVFFAKRAQICPLDLSIVWAAHGFAPLVGLEQLSAFADYRLPQALRHLAIMDIDESLARQIDRLDVIEAGSEPEVELRAATIWGVERMREALARRGLDVPAWQIDWFLWNRAHDADVVVPHHRTRTTFY